LFFFLAFPQGIGVTASTTISPSTLEPLMLDVHPPHEAAHTWKDFFIHIATIVVGLIIAVGLEQTVEFFHHRHQLREARTELAAERDLNRLILQQNIIYGTKIQNELGRDMAALRHRLADPHFSLDGQLHYEWFSLTTPDGEWQAVRQDNTLSLMPAEEVRKYTYRYEVLAGVMNAMEAFNTQIEAAGAIARRAPASDLTPQDVQDLIAATSQAQGTLSLTQKFLGFERDYGLDDSVDYSFLNHPGPPGEPAVGLPNIP
jgi:hypothetical protein